MDLEKYYKEFSENLEKVEAKEANAIRRFLIQEYNKGVDDFLNTGKTNRFDGLFKKPDLEALYINLYRNIGLHFAKWYRDSAIEYIRKETDTTNYNSLWEEHFAAYGKTVAGEKIKIVSGTAKAKLESTLRRLTKDPEFQRIGILEQGRILRTKFKGLSVYQANRIARTEATNIANYGTNRASQDIFGSKNLEKIWITTMDGRQRDNHAFANNQKVDFEKPFFIGGERMMRPGDSSLGASAANIVNCRCTSVPVPKENAAPLEPVTSIGFGLAGTTARTLL